MRSVGAVLVAALVGGSWGCRDLELPAQGGGGADGGLVLPGATRLSLLAPDLSQVLAPAAEVRLSVQDDNGLRSVTLACGDALLATWVADGAQPRELERRVDLAPCRPADLPSTGGEAQVAFVLQTVDATGVQQGHGPFAARILFPARGQESAAPVLSLELPPRVAPLSPVTLRVRSDVPLPSAPSVSVDGRPAAVRAEPPANGGAPLAWVAELPEGAALEGAPATDGGTPPDLFTTERQVQVRALAVGASGASTQVSAPLTVSRVRWERVLPFAAFRPARFIPAATPLRLLDTRPVATPEGLVVPVARTDLEGFNDWLPVLVEAGTGGVVQLPAGPVSSGADARGLDGRGRVLLQYREGPVAGQLLSVSRATGGDGVTVPQLPSSMDFLPVGERLCQQQVVEATRGDGGFACPTESSQLVLECLEADGTLSRTEAPAGLVGAEGPPQYHAASGDGALGLRLFTSFDEGGGACCPTCGRMGMRLAGGVLQTVSGLPDPASSFERIDRIVPDGAGGYVVSVVDSDAQGIVQALVLRPDATSFARVNAAEGPVPPEALLGAAPGGRVVWLERAPQATRVVWAGPGEAKTGHALPGSFMPFPFDDRGSGDDTHLSTFQADGSGLALLTRSVSDPYVTLVRFGPGLVPLWAYVYPRPSDDVRVLAAPDGRSAYLVDMTNSVVASLAL
jgi:hypothetical protein